MSTKPAAPRIVEGTFFTSKRPDRLYLHAFKVMLSKQPFIGWNPALERVSNG